MPVFFCFALSFFCRPAILNFSVYLACIITVYTNTVKPVSAKLPFVRGSYACAPSRSGRIGAYKIPVRAESFLRIAHNEYLLRVLQAFCKPPPVHGHCLPNRLFFSRFVPSFSLFYFSLLLRLFRQISGCVSPLLCPKHFGLFYQNQPSSFGCSRLPSSCRQSFSPP